MIVIYINIHDCCYVLIYYIIVTDTPEIILIMKQTNDSYYISFNSLVPNRES